MNEQRKKSGKILKRALIAVLCFVLVTGTALTIMASSLSGDINGDGKVTAFDAQMLAEYKAGLRELTPEQLARAAGLTIRNIINTILGRSLEEDDAEDSTLADGIQATIEVKAEDGIVTEAVSYSTGSVSVTVPAGVKVDSTTLTLTVQQKDSSEGNVSLEDGQELLPLDIHIEGVSAENTTPIIICVGGALDTGLNLGNVTLYHVEDGVSNTMTQVEDAAELTVHNTFYYDPVTGDVTVAMATFSEVALVSDTAKAWEGGFANFTGSGTEEDPYIIANADQLAYMSQLVSNDEDAAGAHYKLISDINLNGDYVRENDKKEWVFYPIGYWKQQEGTNSAGETWYGAGNSFTGTFDGNGNTISNIYQNTWLMDGNYDNGYWKTAMGLFGALWGATIKNLTIDNFQSDGEVTPTGCIAAYAGGQNMLFENISLTNCNPRVYNTGNGGLVGLNYNSTSGTADNITFRNITVDQTNKISALWGSYDVSCGGILGRLRENSKHDGTNTGGQTNTVTFENCHVSAILDVYNDVCANYQYYQYRYSGMFIGTVDYIGDVPAVGLEDVVFATDCTVTYGNWNEYWYCELVKNSLASYTHDHQFSRLTKITSVSEIQDESGNWNTEGNFVLPADDNSSAECYHIFKNAEGNLYQHLHDVADESNPAIYETTDIDGNGELDDLKEDRQCYYIPFGQLWTGYGWGSSPVYNADAYENIGIKIKEEGSTVKSEQKFTANDVATVEADTPVELSDLFTLSVDESKLSKSTLAVFVSPVDDSTAAAKVSIDTNNWGESTLTFSGAGAAKIVITDYFYCTETVLNVTVGAAKPVDKFVANSVEKQTAGAEIALGTLFDTVEDAEIDHANVAVTVGDDVAYEYTPNTEDWAQGTLKFEATGSVTVTINDQNLCNDATVTFHVVENPSFTTALPEANFLYRVGNLNTVALGNLFEAAKTGATINGTVQVSAVSLLDNTTVVATASADPSSWLTATMQFDSSFTGPVAVTIDALGAEPYTQTLEVINATNVTTYSELGNRNSVLLKDITMSSGSSYYLYGATLYGNGFTFDVSDGAYDGTGSITSNYLVCINNAHLDNVKIVGAVYTAYGATASDDYNRPAVLSYGNSTITNCYISNCASPVRVRDGNLEITNTTLKGGNFANLDIRNGNVVLENVTTINQSNGNDQATDGTVVVGLGVVIYYEQVQSTTTVEIKGTLTQYNYISDNDEFSSAYAKQLVKVMLGSDHTDLQLEKDGVTWANAGIVSMTAGMQNNIIDSRTDKGDYTGKIVTFQSVDGYVYTVVPTADDVTKASPVYETTGQGEIAPSYSFDYTTKNYVAKTDGSNDYCYEESGTVMIAMDEGESFTWDTSILTATKNGQTLDYTVSMDGTDYTGKSITFNTSGTYSVDYTYTDNNNYTVEANGGISTYSKTYTKTVHINVSVIAPEAQNATFIFGSDGTVSTQVTINNNTYVMPNVTATSDTIGSITVSGTTVYYPIVDGYTSDGKTEHSSVNSWYMCFPVLKNAVTITDYADSGTGSAVTYGSSTTTMPSGLSLTAYSSYLTAVPSGTVSMTTGGADAAFKYQASTAASSTPTTLDSVLIYASPTLSNNARNELYLLVQYKYQDNAGATYYYYVGYHTPQTTAKCVTGDTLVTLADGSKKRVDAVTYEDQLLVWNFFTGEYDAAPAAILFYHGDDLYEVLKLTFDDGTIVKVVNNHGFYHVDSNNFVIIDKDNVESYLGSDFVKSAADGYENVTLTGYELIEEYTGSYSIQTAQHNNFFVEGMFSITMPEYEGWFDYFEIGDNMKYDEAKMQADIEKYGLYTYEDFAEYVTYEQFIAFNGPYLKVLVGRGVVTYEQILELIESYVAPLN